MMHQTTGSTCSPVGGVRARGATLTALVVGLAALLSGRVPLALALDNNTVDGIFCGIPLSGHLDPGASNTFNTSLPAGTVVSVDTRSIDAGLLKQQSVNFTPATSDLCSGNLLLTVPSPPPGVDAPPGSVIVTDCGPDTVAHDYTITLSVVSDVASNCAVPLPCGKSLDARFSTPGAVDSYLFPGMAGDTITFAVTNVTSPGGLRTRLFDPSGASIYDDKFTCPGTGPIQMSLPASGNYTALISGCSSAAQGKYTVTWQAPNCTATQPSGQFAYVTNADTGTMSVIDLSTNTTKLTVPIVPQGGAEVGSQAFVAISPTHGAFAWATYGPASTASVVNTSTNLLVASVPSGIDGNGVAISADGTTAYIVSNSLGGIVLVDTANYRPTRLIGVPDLDSAQGVAAATTPDGIFLYTVTEEGLVKISTDDYTIAAVTPLDIGLYDAFAVSPDGTYAYVGTLEGIAVVDTTTNLQSGTISAPSDLGEPFAIAFTQDGHTAYATLPDTGDPNNPNCQMPQPTQPCQGIVAVIDTASQQVVHIITGTGDSPGGVAINPNTHLVYVTDFTASVSDPGVFVIDPKTNKVTSSFSTLGSGPSSIALTTAPTGLCVGDDHGQSEVLVNDIIAAVNEALYGCPGQFPPVSVPFR